MKFDAACFDIETTDLSAVGAGFVLCAVVQPLDGKPKVFRLKEKPGREKQLITDILNELYKYDLLVGHNIQKFDLPFLMTRALRLGVAVPNKATPLIYDTMVGFRRTGLRTRLNQRGKPSASLAMITDLFGIPQEKTALYPDEQFTIVWDGSKKAMRDLVDHCLRDVRMNIQVFHKVFPLDPKRVLKPYA